MVKTRDKDSLSIAATAIWSCDHWFPDSSIAFDPPILNSSSSTLSTCVVGKEVLLSCVKYTKNQSEPITDIWDTIDQVKLISGY